MENARVNNSVILSNAWISRNATIERAILDKNVVVQEGAEVGVNHEADRARGYAISDGGITIVGKGATVTRV
jgi:glucose-1-phosphate adenylyltransferase